MGRNRVLTAAVTLLAASTLVPAALPAQEGSGIQGTWVFDNEEEDRPRGLLIFTESHYSMMFVRGEAPRATYPEDRSMTDAETLVAYRSITANSGQYTLEGDRLTVTAYLANDPNYMAAWPENAETFTVRIVGDTMTWTTDGLIGLGATVSLRRVR
jgi:hypothetical protein